MLAARSNPALVEAVERLPFTSRILSVPATATADVAAIFMTRLQGRPHIKNNLDLPLASQKNGKDLDMAKEDREECANGP